MSELLERRVVISGIGQSEINAGGGPSDLDLTLDACLEAVADAGLELRDIDGLSTYPGAGYGPPGLAGPGTMQLEETLRLDLNWFQGAPEGSAQLTGFVAACMAIASGVVSHVLCYRTVAEGTARLQMRSGNHPASTGPPAAGSSQWTMPFGSLSPATSLSMYAQRHMHEFGTTREQIGALAVSNRRHAALNPKALKRDPITLADYLAARPIAGPFGLLDCDIPCDVATAVVLSRADYASAPRPPVRIEALGTAFCGYPSFEYWQDYTEMNAWHAARHMWSRTDLRPSDVDFAQLYDGFSWLLLFWLKAAGFCGKGEGGAFVEGGRRFGLDGELPLNTYGGQLSAGRLHGWGNIHEACLQLSGRAGDRQLARHDVAVVSVGGGSIAGSLVLTR